MKLNVKKFQEGGMAPEAAPQEAPQAAPQEAPEAGGQEEMMAQLQEVAASIIQQMGPEAAMILAQMIVEMVQGGAAQPAQPAMARRGGKLVRL